MDLIRLETVGKKFNKRWIFKDINLTIDNSNHYALVGANGSGKSTLLQIISSYMLPSTGELVYRNKQELIPAEEVYKHISLATPYMELIEEFSLQEVLQFHQRIKGFKEGFTPEKIIALLNFEKQKSKPIKNYSSGMKQRVKLALALFSDTSLLLLDEPTSNLDKAGIDWYQKHLIEQSQDRMVLICSNHKDEDLFSCKEFIRIESYLP